MRTTNDAWNDDEPISRHGITVPKWIDQDITPADVAAIVQGGCDSGAYMPAVTYYRAQQTMDEHEHEILDYLESVYASPLNDLVNFSSRELSWSGLACLLVSRAVEFWAASALEQYTEQNAA